MVQSLRGVAYVEWEPRWSWYLALGLLATCVLAAGLVWLSTRPTSFERRCDELLDGVGQRAPGGKIALLVEAERMGCPGVYVD